MEKSREAPWGMLLQAVQRYNILPITSRCNVRCVFCSHQQNPPGVRVYEVPSLDIGQVEQLFPFLDAGRKVVIGESATTLKEGEPLTHPQVMQILEKVREAFPTTPVELTTNGSLLSPEKIKRLAKLAPLELNLSLNSASVKGRLLLMQDRQAETAIKAGGALTEAGIPFHGSVVAMPWINGWDDLRQTLIDFDRVGARTVRVFLPGHTRLAPDFLRCPPDLREKLSGLINDLQGIINVPTVLDPPLLDDLLAEVEGVTAGSPGAAGFCRGDVILAVEGQPVKSRVHAFQQIQRQSNPVVLARRAKETILLPILKKTGESSGLVFSYDLDPEVWQNAVQQVRRHRAGSVLVLTSMLAAVVVRRAQEADPLPAGQVYIKEVPNRFFGGSIMAGGLLVVNDFRAALLEWRQEHPGIIPDLMLLPGIAFDPWGHDLTGVPYWELEEDLPLVLV
ncbi:MAG: radical SAM protein [Bacillota bacterium]